MAARRSILSSFAIGTGAGALFLAGLTLPASATAAPVQGVPATAQNGSTQLLPNTDVRDGMKPDQGATASTAALERSLGAEGSVNLDPQTGTVDFVRRTDGYLTGPSTAAAADIVTGYVRSRAAAFGLTAADLSTLGPVDQYTSIDGVTHVVVPQVVGGIESYDTMLMGNVDAKGRLINVTGAPAADLSPNTLAPTLDADAALQAARADVGGDSTVPAVTKRGGGADRSVRYATQTESARLVVFAQPGEDRLAWDVNVLDSNSFLYRVAVDAVSGKTLARTSLTAFDSNDANVWSNYPSQTRTPNTVNFGTDPTWLDRSAANGNQLIGNNAHAYHDDNGTNGYQAGEEVVRNGNVNWTYPMTWFNQAGCPAAGCTWNSAVAGSRTTNRNAGTVSLFYLTNHFHDHLLAAPIGFDEASRNFEQVNSSGQGLGGDAVLAESQDSIGVNNANFSTPPDGAPGRMQMFVWDGTSGAVGPQYDVDGSAAADVVYHEYGHGLSNRLVGNGAGLGAIQSGAMGEAWSDFYALDLLVAEGEIADSPATPGEVWMGEYATGVPGIFGGISRIRHQAIDCSVGTAPAVCPASGNAGSGGYTYGDLGKVGTTNGVHDSGEIWSQTLWDLRKALGRTNALKIITGGMRLSPNNPSMLDMRDSILQSALVNGLNASTVWQVFASRGFGFFATTPNSSTNSATEDFTMPPDLVHVSTVYDDNAPRGDGDGVAEPGETLLVRTTIQNLSGAPISGVTGSLAAPGAVVNRGTTTWPTIPSGATATNSLPFAVTVPENFACGQSFDMTVSITGPTGPVPAVPVVKVPVPGTPNFVAATDVPKAIPDNNASGVNSVVTLPGTGTVSDVDLKIGQLTHTWVGDLKITLSHGGVTVILANRPGAGTNGASGDNFVNLTFDDSATTPIESIPSSAPAGGYTGSYRPDEPLSAFNGQSWDGPWTLNISDNAATDTGTLISWSLSAFSTCPASFGVPVATTAAAQGTTPNATTFAGSLDAKGRATDYRFEWGTSVSYGQLSPVTAGGLANGAVPVTWSQTGLTPGTDYHFRLLALRDGVVLSTGADQVVRTADLPPVAVTGAVAAVGQSTATFTGSVDANNVATSYRFEYGPTTAYGSTTPVGGAGSGPDPVDVSADVTGLNPSTDYHVRLVALRGDVVLATGADQAFRTSDVPATPQPPSAPRGVKARPANRAAVVSWLAPASAGSSPITGYTVTAIPGGRTCTTTGARTCIVRGLTNRVAYRFTVRASSLAGTGPASARSLPIIAGAPTAPVRVAVSFPVARQAKAAWTVPASRGSGAILRYQVRWSANAGRTWTAWITTGLVRSAVRVGLVKGRSYRVEVRAVNASGAGPATAVTFRQAR